MIISRTPLRMSFAGGGSDMPVFYRAHGGAVLSVSLDKYIYVTVNPKFDNGIRVAYSKTEEVESVAKIEHRLVRAALEFLEVPGGIEITTIADIPSRGTGLGSSSAFTVALLHALHAYLGRHASRDKLAQESCRLEIEICCEPIGKQDQYAAAFGGLNLIEFNSDETVDVSPLICDRKTVKELRENLLLLYTGITRSASDILREQNQAISSHSCATRAVERMVQLCYDLREELQENNVDALGEILHESWQLKKTLAGSISSPVIDDWYSTARRNGAIGGKILGAGAGGFLLLYAPRERHEGLCRALPLLRPIDFDFERMGSQIIFYQPEEEKERSQAGKYLLNEESRAGDRSNSAAAGSNRRA